MFRSLVGQSAPHSRFWRSDSWIAAVKSRSPALSLASLDVLAQALQVLEELGAVGDRGVGVALDRRVAACLRGLHEVVEGAHLAGERGRLRGLCGRRGRRRRDDHRGAGLRRGVIAAAQEQRRDQAPAEQQDRHGDRDRPSRSTSPLAAGLPPRVAVTPAAAGERPASRARRGCRRGHDRDRAPARAARVAGRACSRAAARPPAAWTAATRCTSRRPSGVAPAARRARRRRFRPASPFAGGAGGAAGAAGVSGGGAGTAGAFATVAGPLPPGARGTAGGRSPVRASASSPPDAHGTRGRPAPGVRRVRGPFAGRRWRCAAGEFARRRRCARGACRRRKLRCTWGDLAARRRPRFRHGAARSPPPVRSRSPPGRRGPPPDSP